MCIIFQVIWIVEYTTIFEEYYHLSRYVFCRLRRVPIDAKAKNRSRDTNTIYPLSDLREFHILSLVIQDEVHIATRPITNAKAPKWLAERRYNLTGRNLTSYHNSTTEQGKSQDF